MAINKQAVTILMPTPVPAGRNATNPVWGDAVDVRPYRGGEWGYRVTNGASAPTVGCTIVLQTSPTGNADDWFDYHTIAGDTLANGGINRSVRMPPSAMFARVGGYGNAINDVTISSRLQAEVG